MLSCNSFEPTNKISPCCLPGPAHPANVRACSWNHGLVAVAYHTIIYIINPLTCNICYAYNGHVVPVTSIAFKTNDFITTTPSPNNTDFLIASGDASGKVHIWGIWSSTSSKSLECYDKTAVVSLSWDNSSANAVIVLFRSGNIVSFDITTRTQLWMGKQLFKEPMGFTDSTYSRCCFGVFGGSTMSFCNLASSIFNSNNNLSTQTTSLNTGETINRMRYSILQRQIVYVLLQNHFLIFDSALHIPLSTFNLSEESNDFCLLQNEKCAMVLSKSGTVYVYEIVSEKEIKLIGKLGLIQTLSRGKQSNVSTVLSIINDPIDDSNILIRTLDGSLIFLKFTKQPFSLIVHSVIHSFPSNLLSIASKQLYFAGITEDGILYIVRSGYVYRIITLPKMIPQGILWINDIICVYGSINKDRSTVYKNVLMLIQPQSGEILKIIKVRNYYGQIKSIHCSADGKNIAICYQTAIEDIEYGSFKVNKLYERTCTGLAYGLTIHIIEKNEMKQNNSRYENKKGNLVAIATKSPFTVLADTKGNLIRLTENKKSTLSFLKHVQKILFCDSPDCYHALILVDNSVIVIDIATMNIISETMNYLVRIKTPVKDIFWLQQYPGVLLRTGEVFVLDIALLVCCNKFKEQLQPLPINCLEPIKQRNIIFNYVHELTDEEIIPKSVKPVIVDRLIALYKQAKDEKHYMFWRLIKWVVEEKLPINGTPYVQTEPIKVTNNTMKTKYSKALKSGSNHPKKQLFNHSFAMSEMRLGHQENAFTYFLKVLDGPVDAEYFSFAIRACLLSMSMGGDVEQRQQLILSLFKDPTPEKTQLIQLYKLLNLNQEVCKLYIDLGKFEEAMVVSSLYLDDTSRTEIFLSIVLRYMFDNCWIKAIELLASMGRLIDVIRLLLYTGHIEMAAHVGMILVENKLFDLDMELHLVYQLIQVPNQDERKFKTLKELIKQVYSEYIHCMESIKNTKAIQSFKESKWYIE
ncbi:WD domain containing protein [Entamoeba marina]